MTPAFSKPRILYLSSEPDSVRRQIDGEALLRSAAMPLRDDVSTDEITPITVMHHIDQRLGDFPLVGFTVNGERPIGEGDIRRAGFSVLVAGRRYGKGSSREHSPLAELYADVRIIFAESFERVYRQNADNVGLITSTDFSLLAKLEAGELVTIEQLTAEREPLSAAIIKAGGLLAYGSSRTAPSGSSPVPNDRGETLAQKILRRHLLRSKGHGADNTAGAGAFVEADWRFTIEFYTGMIAHMLHARIGRPAPLVSPDGIIGFAEHFSYIDDSPAHRDQTRQAGIKELHRLHEEFVSEYRLKNYGNLAGRGSHGICHSVMTERHALPGQIVVGTDSHTPHAGALGCLAFGVGATEMANAFVTGAVRVTIPESVKVEFSGETPLGVGAKDLVLALLAHPFVRSGGGIGKVFEFTGAAVARLSVDERATLTNMSAELGGFSGIVAPDDKTVAFLAERRGIAFAVEPWMASDPDAAYAEIIEIDCTDLSPMVARPGDPGNGVPLASLTNDVRIDVAYGGSCTGGKQEDFDEYFDVLRRAYERGAKVPDDVAFYLQFSSLQVREYCERKGYIATFEGVGAKLLLPACGACANLGPGASDKPDQVTVSAQNRNFPGRSGPGQIWLASPATVAASAIAGKLISANDLFDTLERSPTR